MNLDRGVRGLELWRPACQTCGDPRGSTPGMVVRLLIDLDHATPLRKGPDTCPECGPVLVVRLLLITLGEEC